MNRPPLLRESMPPANQARSLTLRALPHEPLQREWSFNDIPAPSRLDTHSSIITESMQSTGALSDTPPVLPIRRRGEATSESLPSPSSIHQNRPNRSAQSRNLTAPLPRARRSPIPNPFGTREEIEADNYESPLQGMFTRAWSRYRAAEEIRRSNPIAPDSEIGRDSNHDGLETHANEPEGSIRQQSFEAMMMQQMATLNFELDAHTTLLRDLPQSALLRAGMTAAQTTELGAHAQSLEHETQRTNRGPVNPIDTQTSRPAARNPEELTVSVACQICREQVVDTLLEPCMHIALCRWCSEIIQQQSRRVRHAHQQNGWKCPICRRRVVNARRVYLS
ncbi:hypothetical protein LTR84_008389 [Exophiala bonariae]|uniref:RING-type domain-containing protein n=1 Tax=Exophiala bonariae TaxID=1690606 RepID=A0AAV9MXF8_9EURO|nr:hypothetical protein LTR84_008389 [Exophiala bonariae]